MFEIEKFNSEIRFRVQGSPMGRFAHGAVRPWGGSPLDYV